LTNVARRGRTRESIRSSHGAEPTRPDAIR
jgi:hypothetical protein